MKTHIPQTLNTIIESLAVDLGIKTKLEQYSIFPLWNDVVGEQIAKITEPERIDNGLLIVKVSNAPWRTELTFRKKEILTKIHEATKSTAIKDIRFR